VKIQFRPKKFGGFGIVLKVQTAVLLHVGGSELQISSYESGENLAHHKTTDAVYDLQ